MYGLGLREPGNAAATAGKKVHALLEDWYKTGEKPPNELLWDNYDLGRMVWNLSYVAPDRTLVTRSEATFVLELYGVEFTGIVDGQTNDTIFDFKTTSKLQYVKSNEELSLDVQRLLYVAALPDKTKTTWLYGVWSDYSTHERSLTIDPLSDREKFKLHVLKPAEEICSLGEGVDPLSLEPNKDACKMYPPNGCMFKNKCFPVNRTAAKMTKLLDNLKAASKEPTQVMPLEKTHKIDLINAPETANKEVSFPAPKPVEVNDAKPIEFLFIDSYPISGIDSGVTPAHEIIFPSARAVADDGHVPHPLLIDFAKGGPMIAAQLANDLKGKSFKYVYLETKSAEGRAVMNTLMNLSKFVVKGMI